MENDKKRFPDPLGAESAKRLARYIELQAEARTLLLGDEQLCLFLESIRKDDWSSANLRASLLPSLLAS